MTYFFQLSIALFLDTLFGDPRWYPHPVRIIGNLCTLSERVTRKYIAAEAIAGMVTVGVVTITTTLIVISIVITAYSIDSIFGDLISIVLLYTAIAAKDLLKHSTIVYTLLVKEESLDKARQALGQIVGRDTHQLNSEEVSKACIETVAENMVDGITAPLFFAITAGLASSFFNISPIGCSAAGAYFYKSVNTLDSMIGYKNETYLKFGRVAAKLDDFVNFIPARISSICLIMAAFFLKLDYRGATRIFFRDRLQHSSPNAGHPEAVVAGALGVRLGGPSVYFGKIVEKPFMGDSLQNISPEDILRTHRLAIVGSLIFFMLMMCLYGAAKMFTLF